MKQGFETEAERIPAVTSWFGAGTCREIALIQNGLSNHNYAVRTDQGEYVVKFLVTQSPGNIENDVAIQRQLLRAGVKTLQYLRHPGGDFVYRGRDGVSAVMSRRLDGMIPPRITVELVSNIGRHLALFHASVSTCPNFNGKGLMNLDVSGIDADWARHLLSRPLPKGVIHGDLHSGNVLVDPLHPEVVTAILDFEEAGENLYLVDLAATLVGVSASLDGELIDPQLVQAAKQGYEAVRPLTDEENRWLPLAFRYANEAWINWFRRYGFDDYARQYQRRYDGCGSVFGDAHAS